MRRVLAGGFELDDDPARVDLEAVHAYLAGESYWARDRPLEVQRRLNEQATRLVGLYGPDGAQVGFTRTAYWPEQDLAFLFDVYVLEPFRGGGLGLELVRETVEGGEHAGALWLLRTADMHRLYAKLGFGQPDEAWMVRGRGPDRRGFGTAHP
jgi:GNAT superfamily N-acetyltransferase